MKKRMKRLIALLCIVVMIGVMIPADILPVVAQENEEDSLKKVLTNCDSKSEASNIAVTATNGTTTYTSDGKAYKENAEYIKEGEASLAVTKTIDNTKNTTLYNIFLSSAVDVRGYKYFSCQLYIPKEGYDNLKDSGNALGIALSPEIGDSNKNALHFYLAKSELKEGWNEIKLSFALADVIRNGNKDQGTYNGSAIRYIRIFQFGGVENIKFTSYLDDVCVLNENQGLLIADCDQKKAPGATLLTGEVTNEYDRYNVDNAYASILVNGNSSIIKDNYKEGTGALKAKCYKHSNGQYRMLTSVTLSEAATLDISQRVEQDVLHMWLYIGNWSYLQGEFYINLTSSGDAIDSGVTWTIKKDDLQTGWNEIVKPLSSGTPFGTNPIEWDHVNYIRVYTVTGATEETYQKADAYMLLDDIRIAEKEVFAQSKERGTVIPGGTAEPDETAEPTLDGYEFGGYFKRYNSETKEFGSPLTEEQEATSTSPVYIRWVPKEVMTVKAQVRQEEHDDCKKVLTSCDSLNGNSNIADPMPNPSKPEETFMSSGTVSKARVKEGEASLYKKTTINQKNSSGNVSNVTLYNIFLNDAVDVRGYKYFSCQLYLSSLDDLKSSGNALGIVLNSVYGESNTNALHFYLEKDDLQVGWNDLKLAFSQADVVANSSATNRYNGAAINYIRILQYGDSAGKVSALTTYLDDICVLNDNPGVLIADFDQEIENHAFVALQQRNAASPNNELYTANKSEGTGALKSTAFKPSGYMIEAPIVMSDANRLNITDYQDKGYLQFMLYINDKTNWTGKSFTVELRSNGNRDDAEIYWSVPVDNLEKESWNVVRLPLTAYNAETQPQGYNTQKAASNGKDFEWDKVNAFRIFINPVKEADYNNKNYILLDDIRIVDSMPVATCDSTDELATGLTGTQVVKSDDVIQGSGAFVNTANTGKVQHQFRLKTPINFEGFLNTKGCLHFWYYIEDPAYLGNDELRVELSSLIDGWDSHDKEYIINRKSLVPGWNEIYIYLADNTADSNIGNMDWKSIQHIRIYCGANFKQACTTKIDDISLVPGNKETVDVRFISTVESLGYSKVGFEITQSRSETPLITEGTNVYQTLYALGHNGTREAFVSKTISGVDCSKYMHTATVMNIPNRLWDATFTVTPYWVTQNGTRVEGASKTYNINHMLNKSKQILQEEGNIIDIYLIAGQSNASGSSHVLCSQHDSNEHCDGTWNVMADITARNELYTTGFTNVLYSGVSNNDGAKTPQMTIANIHQNGYIGPEVGMAEALSTYYNADTERVAGIIKYAYGGTSLVDKADDKYISNKVGNWASPSYIASLKQNGGTVASEAYTGKLYNNLLAQVRESLQLYRDQGYTPVIKGLYWMQGEADRQLLDEYEIAFNYFVDDIRYDLAQLTGDGRNLEMPIIIGEISETFSEATEAMVAINTGFIELQNQLAEDNENCFVADNSGYELTKLVGGESQNVEGVFDGAHWNWQDCLAIGNNVGNIIKSEILLVAE